MLASLDRLHHLPGSRGRTKAHNVPVGGRGGSLQGSVGEPHVVVRLVARAQALQPRCCHLHAWLLHQHRLSRDATTHALK